MQTDQRAAQAITRTQSTSRRWGIIALLCVAFMVAYFDRQNLSIALTARDFKDFFQLSDDQRGLLNSAFFWSYTVLQIPAGWFVDRFGAKRIFAAGFALWSIFAGCTAWAGSATQLFWIRLAVGGGEAINTPAGMRWIRLNIEDRQHGFVMGLYQASAKIGPAIGAPLAAWLTVAYGWRAMFMVFGFGALFWLIPWMLLVEDDHRDGSRKIEGAKRPGVRQVPFTQLMRSPAMWGIIIGTFSYNYFNYFCLTWLPAYFAERRGLSLNSTGWFTGYSYWGFAIVAIAAGLLADRMVERGRDAVLTRKAFIIAGFVMASTELIGAISSSNNVALFFAVFSLSGLGLATGNYWALSGVVLPRAPAARLAAVQNTAASLPGICAPLVTGWLKQLTGGYESAMVVNFVLLLLGIASYIFLVRESRAEPEA